MNPGMALLIFEFYRLLDVFFLLFHAAFKILLLLCCFILLCSFISFYLISSNRCIICLNMTPDDDSKKRKDDASSSLSVMTGTGPTASTSTNATTIGGPTEGCSAEGGGATSKNDDTSLGTSLDFIGTSNAVKKLFSMSLDSSPSISSSSSSSSKKFSDNKPMLIAIHNFDGTLIIDDAEDESNYDDYCQFNRNNRGNYYASTNTTKTLLPPSSQSLALALSALSPTTTDDDKNTGTIGLQQKSILSSIGFQPIADAAASAAVAAVTNNNNTANNNNFASNNPVQSPSGDNKSYSSNKEQLPSTSALLAFPTAPREYINWKFNDLNLLVGHEAVIVRPPTATTTTTTEAACDGSQQQQKQNQQQNAASASDAGIAVRVEDLQFLQNAWKVFQQQQQQQHATLNGGTYHQSSGNSISNTKATVSEQRSYAQALLQKREEVVSSTSISSSPAENDQKNLAVDRQLGGADPDNDNDNDNDNGDGDIASGEGDEKEKKKDIESLSDLPLQTCIVPFTGPLGGRLSSIESSSSSSSSDPTTNSSTGINDYPSPALSIVLDAYLDNLMANVPQLALCLQEKGLIQSVKLLPTEVIPSMMLHPSTLDTTLPLDIIHSHSTNSSNNNHHRRSSSGIKTEDMFSPQIMEMNASALMRFLKTNCTRNHATYLLRHETLSGANSGRRNKQQQHQKQHNIHLYDISSISTQGQKKWIWWLATMSFRFALRLRHLESSASSVSESHKRAIRDRQRSLYQQTLDLLQDLMDVDGNAHESMVASVREHMADTYLSSVVGGREVADNNPSTESAEMKNNTPPTATSTRNASSPSSEFPSSPSPPVVTMTTTNTISSLNSINSAKLSQPEYSPTMPSADSTNIRCQERQPYATLTIDALNKAQDHLVCGIKTLSSLFEKDLEERRLYQETKKLEEGAALKRSRRRQRPRAQHKINSESNNQEEKDEQIPKLSPAMMMQLFGMNYKLVNISLRLAEHHLGNYYSSSAMQALRSAARRLVDAAHLLDYYEIEMKRGEELVNVSKNGDNREDEKWQESLQLQYIWLMEHCGHFARSFASDELWRDRGHTSGEDVIQILRDVENAFVDDQKMIKGKYNREDRAYNSRFWKMVQLDALVEKSKGNVSLQSLSAVVAPFNMNAKKSEEAIAAARKILAKQRVLQRERRNVLVAASISYHHAITSFQCIVTSLDQKDPTYDKLVLLNLLRQRLGDACNEVGKVLLAALRTLLASNQGRKKDDVSQLAAEVILDSAEFWFAQGLESFKACHDMRNLALLRCNLCQSYKLRANSGFAKQDSTSSSKHAEDCLQQAANQLLTAHEDLNQRDVDPRTWDMVSEQLASTFLVLGVRRRQSLLGGGNAPVIFQVMRLSPGEERSILDPMTRALEIYQQSDNNHQAAATHYQLALTFSKLWTCQLNESNTRKKLSKAFEHYSLAFTFFSNNFRGNEPTFCLLCLDLASLYDAIPGEEGLLKALGCCLDSCDAFSMDSSAKATVDCYDKMATIAESVDDRVFKLLRSLVKIDASRYKDLYREGLTAKMVRNVPDDDELDVNPKAAALLTLYEVLCAIKKKYGVIVSK
jgi:hypothetical protein